MTGTSTPTNPSWVDDLVKGVGTTVGSLSSVDPTSFVAPINSTLGTANANALNLSGSPSNYDGALGMAGAVGNQVTPSISGHISEFMNPYLKDVVGATAADLDQSDGKVRAQQTLDLARGGAFGGSGAALTQSGTEGELSRARASALGALRSHGFDTALSGATSQAGIDSNTEAQRLAAANSIGSLATQQQQTARDNISAQSSIGQLLQQIQQASAGSPLNTAGSLSQILAQLPLNLFHGTDTTGTQNGTTTGSSAVSGATIGEWLNFLKPNSPSGGGGG